MFFLVPAEVGNLNVPVLRPVPILEIGSVWQELQDSPIRLQVSAACGVGLLPPPSETDTIGVDWAYLEDKPVDLLEVTREIARGG